MPDIHATVSKSSVLTEYINRFVGKCHGGRGAAHSERRKTLFVALVGLVASLHLPALEVPSKGVALEGGDSERWDADFNLFVRHPRLGIRQGEVEAKLQTAWLRYSGQKDIDGGFAAIKRDAADKSLAYADVNVAVPGNTWDGGPRACTEGQGWAMMLAVQANDQPLFDCLWRFTQKYLQYQTVTKRDDRGWLFCWTCLPQPNGGVRYRNNNDITLDGVAPDGEQWITAALYIAHGRWGRGSSQIDYRLEADRIADSMLHVEDLGLGRTLVTNLFQKNQVVYIPGDFPKGPNLLASELSDTSYCLPAFYQLFASLGPATDSAAWEAILQNARTRYLPRALGMEAVPVNDNGATGLAPYITTLDGTGYDCNSTDGEGADSGHITAGDGQRPPSNMGVDYMWWADGSTRFNLHKKYANTLLAYFADPKPFNGPDYVTLPFGNHGHAFPFNHNRFYYGGFVNTNGRDGDGSKASNHNEASTGMNAVAAIMSTNPVAWDFVQELWEAPQPRKTGVQETSTWGEPYWDGTLYLFGLFEVGGKFRAYGVERSAIK